MPGPLVGALGLLDLIRGGPNPVYDEFELVPQPLSPSGGTSPRHNPLKPGQGVRGGGLVLAPKPILSNMACPGQ